MRSEHATVRGPRSGAFEVDLGHSVRRWEPDSGCSRDRSLASRRSAWAEAVAAARTRSWPQSSATTSKTGMGKGRITGPFRWWDSVERGPSSQVHSCAAEDPECGIGALYPKAIGQVPGACALPDEQGKVTEVGPHDIHVGLGWETR